MRKETEKEHCSHLLVELWTGSTAVRWFLLGWGELGPGLRRGAVGERLSKGTFIVVDFVSSVSEFPVEN